MIDHKLKTLLRERKKKLTDSFDNGFNQIVSSMPSCSQAYRFENLVKKKSLADYKYDYKIKSHFENNDKA